LVWLCLSTSFGLQVDYLFNSLFAEYVMTSADAFLEAQNPQQATHAIKWNISIPGTAQYPH